MVKTLRSGSRPFWIKTTKQYLASCVITVISQRRLCHLQRETWRRWHGDNDDSDWGGCACQRRTDTEQWLWSLLHKRLPIRVNCYCGEIESLWKPFLNPPLLYYQPLLPSYPLDILLLAIQCTLWDGEFHSWSITGGFTPRWRTFNGTSLLGEERANSSVLMPLIHRKSQWAPHAILSPMHSPHTWGLPTSVLPLSLAQPIFSAWGASLPSLVPTLKSYPLRMVSILVTYGGKQGTGAWNSVKTEFACSWCLINASFIKFVIKKKSHN